MGVGTHWGIDKKKKLAFWEGHRSGHERKNQVREGYSPLTCCYCFLYGGSSGLTTPVEVIASVWKRQDGIGQDTERNQVSERDLLAGGAWSGNRKSEP